ncbi:hypothetical protein [Aliikangiella sp. IMCC44359]|uniref:hypothetical protein n=1 Tax=Aliikangiella sp. IMCC44359 TaxID=3459125 RepID=UPI00403AA296
MKIGRLRITFSRREAILIAFVPVVMCLLLVMLVNLQDNYLIEAKLVTSKVFSPQLKRGALKGLQRNYKKMVRANMRLEQYSTNLSFQQRLALIESYDFFDSFIQTYQLKPILYPKRWDQDNQSWKKREDSVLKIIIRLFSGDIGEEAERENREPKDFFAVKKLSKKIKVKPDKLTGLLNVSLTWKDSKEGARLLKSFIEHANYFIAQRNKFDIDKQIRSLEALVKKENNVNFKNILNNQLSEIQSFYLLNDPVYRPSFKVITPVIAPVEQTLKLPKIKLFLFYFVSLFFVLACVLWYGNRSKQLANIKTLVKPQQFNDLHTMSS